MFGHPGISALEYAGQVEKMKEQQRKSETSLKRRSGTSTQDKTNSSTTAGAEENTIELSSPLHFVDEFGCQQRRRGTFINHTPRNYELRSSQAMEMSRPSRAESENYSRPLSRQSSMASGSPAIASQPAYSPSTNSSSFGKRSTLNHETVAELDSTEIGMSSSPEVYMPSRSHRRSLSAPHGKILTYEPGTATSVSHPSKDPSLRSTSLASHQPRSPEKKRQRRQTPFKLITSTQINVPRHAPLEPWVAEHRRKETTETIETIGDVPVDMDRELSAEFGTFGVIQRYFESQGGGSVAESEDRSTKLSGVTLPVSDESSLGKSFLEPIAIYPIEELELPNDPPPVPDRSPKRLTNPAFPTSPKSLRVRDSDFNIAAEGEYSPYEPDGDVLHVAKKRTSALPRVEHAAWIGSPNVGRLAPPILGHDAITASSNLGLNDLSFWLKNTGPPSAPQAVTQEQKKKGMKLFKVKQRKSLAARVGSVEGSPQRARNRPAVPSCAKEMTTSKGARHLKIIIPTEPPAGYQPLTLPIIKQRHSRHISISFTEEMLNPLASPAVEHIISTLEPQDRSTSTPVPKSPRSPKRSPKAPKPVPVNDHPLATPSPSRDELTRARKLRDLQRIKRKPVPKQDTSAGALPTPAHTPEPCEREHAKRDDAEDKVARMQDQVQAMQRQIAQLAEALAETVGLDVDGGEVKGEEVLQAWKRMRDSRVVGVK
ncbi:hypothetical protein HBH56_171400 [Parastagonospora nodorum]|uniref:Uncharacterized protein n=2 Tax=Phaeosphaeria nodorum (strain SN15 / ATCC MYA-4574 / FGSC 10173) TaxID=321614 RepID=A0A7U2EX83_PHANO|nr:hypothetical protein SNOG_07754 [Parastagonospora nodorum SN15]KAH3908735.1 hypothetical protein HBH56_171400 [Parastagonospora nodorum]EAT85220.1 hypothetical protein SNOG_07754 [Parastagonospora nodorum SN15]KAH3928493.1 hypothetical protein HBH54_139960 [Parastagonospora nodorum]KAH3945309.1 hypothetical protein HBH53_145310 [Parastagonospora nodorum]KAH3983971.1 hypothetical protein HBH52_058910 [Parastagonospora nodorum]